MSRPSGNSTVTFSITPAARYLSRAKLFRQVRVYPTHLCPCIAAHQERVIPRPVLWAALASEPRLGSTTGTAVYSAAGIEVVVDDVTGRIVTLWWTE